MSIITFVCAGQMNSGITFPAFENGHEIHLVGSPLDGPVLASLRRDNYHPTLKRKLHDGILFYDFEQCEEALRGADLVVGHHSHRMNPIELYNGKYICYSLGNFCFAGNSKPNDMSSFVFQIRFRVKDGACTSRGFRIIPIRISSITKRNDFIPTPYTSGSNIDSVLTVLKNNGRKLEYAVPDYPLDWK